MVVFVACLFFVLHVFPAVFVWLLFVLYGFVLFLRVLISLYTFMVVHAL